MGNETKTFCKDPDGVVNYTIDWSDFLGTDTISTSAWAAATGLTVDSNSINSALTKATVIVSSGTADTSYALTNTMVTVGGVTAERTITIYVEESTTAAAGTAARTLTTYQKLSLMIGDDAQKIFDNAHLQHFLSQNTSDLNLAASDACLAIAANMSLISKLEIIGDHTLDRRSQPKHWLELSKRYSDSAQNEPAIGIIQRGYTSFQQHDILERDAIVTYQ